MRAYIKEIETKLKNGENYHNDSARWYTLSNPKTDTRYIVFYDAQGEEKIKYYKTITTLAIRVGQLLNRGY